MRVLLLGKRGQLGRAFVKKLSSEGYQLVALGREECDVTSMSSVKRWLDEVKPHVVINCTAYNYVDKAEEDYATAFAVNAFAVKVLGELCVAKGVKLIHYSTDYVFDGTKGAPYVEDDKPSPLSLYGKSKYTGELLLQELEGDFLIFRVSWVYGEGKQNFLYKLLNWVKTQDILKISADEVSVPTSTKTIVDVTLKALKKDLRGLYHLTNSGYASRYEYAKKVLRLLKIEKTVLPVPMSVFSLPAKRPSFSAMSNARISKELQIDIPHWEEELEMFLPLLLPELLGS
ncbi:dTDP-4-dehydrorhamnose reductase [Thermocrinis albus DSM 14484]|uniref:dTDP-4-dehydrorhamnose reductase n=1 Tax=Thermocrinis albus (strain DSM 14484 / JCM 11386 / HI 11/12) TaxID=638303 RepID=D3SMW1_THEAH|nr:dTDP-4-dehydrorhamnose reductase [Thermocrinis albus]ADC90091.1 dTDP-4-dehydrorhamnose reductase [Thermocrinis albus DSM 14484]